MTCYKRAYASQREANEILNMVKKFRVTDSVTKKRYNRNLGNKDKRPQRTYKCEDCGQWHLTSEKVKDKFKKRKRGKYE